MRLKFELALTLANTANTVCPYLSKNANIKETSLRKIYHIKELCPNHSYSNSLNPTNLAYQLAKTLLLSESLFIVDEGE